jgi:hypothetical protein
LQGKRNRFIFVNDTKDRPFSRLSGLKGPREKLRPAPVRKGIVDLTTNLNPFRSCVFRSQHVVQNQEGAQGFAAVRSLCLGFGIQPPKPGFDA